MFKPCLYSPTVAFNLYKSPVEPRFYRRRNKVQWSPADLLSATMRTLYLAS